MRRTFAIFARITLLAAIVSSAAAQSHSPQSGGKSGSALKWGLDLAQAVEQAKKSRLPLMLWVQGGPSDRDDSYNDMERDQVKAFGDERVGELARRFVLCKVSRSRYKAELQKWGVRERATLDLVFVTPDGERIDTLSPDGATNRDSLAQKMSLVFGKYRNEIFQKEIKPVLEDEKSTPKALIAALDTIREFHIIAGDPMVIKTLQKGDAAITKKAYETLAALSTKDGIVEVFERAANDKRAAEALDDFTPSAAESLLDHLDGGDPAKMLLAYKAVTKICKVQNIKNDKFWDGKNEKLKQDEIKRVKDLVQKKAKQWRERYDEYR